MYHGYWDMLIEERGTLPEARKGATMNQVNGELYVYGGFSRDTYSDLKVFNVTALRWRDIDMS